MLLGMHSLGMHKHGYILKGYKGLAGLESFLVNQWNIIQIKQSC